MISLATAISAGAGLLIHVGAGCFAPTIVEDDGNVVVLKYGPWDTAHEILGRADALCDAYGKIAEPVSDEAVDLEPDFRYATFDCVSEELPST